MQLGMIGLGRFGANMVRRLITGGHGHTGGTAPALFSCFGASIFSNYARLSHARRMSAFACYRPKPAIPLTANSGLLAAIGEASPKRAGREALFLILEFSKLNPGQLVCGTSKDALIDLPRQIPRRAQPTL
jgi:hypothetical protein